MNDTDLIRELILDKLRGYINSQRGCHIVTAPSSSYPKGKFYNGLVINFSEDGRSIIFMDRFEGSIPIPLPLILNPDDIDDFEGVMYGDKRDERFEQQL